MVAVPTTFVAEARRLIVFGLRFADVLAIVLAGVGAYWFRHGTVAIPEVYLAAMVLGAFLASMYMHFTSLYSFENLVAFSLQFGKVTAVWSAVFVTLIALAYFAQVSENFSRFWVLTWFTLTLILFGVLRVALAFQVESWANRGELDVNVAVIGAGELGKRLIRQLTGSARTGVRIVGVFDDAGDADTQDVDGIPVMGDVDALLEHISRNRVDEIIIAVPWRDHARLRDLTQRLSTVAADVKLCPEEISLELPNIGYGEVAGIQMLKLSERPLSGWNVIAKGLEDRILAILILIAFSPIMLFIAAAIKLSSPGPVFFRQTRYGFNNNEFRVLKFRTMKTDMGNTPKTVSQATRDDPRVTLVGNLLRRTSLDELPQLMNVIRGEMSLVGPRPHAVAHNLEYSAMIDSYIARHRVKPGITGWAQVNGFRGETASLDLMRQRVQLDLYYIEHWSVFFDLRILLMTLFVGFIHRNAY